MNRKATTGGGGSTTRLPADERQISFLKGDPSCVLSPWLTQVAYVFQAT